MITPAACRKRRSVLASFSSPSRAAPVPADASKAHGQRMRGKRGGARTRAPQTPAAAQAAHTRWKSLRKKSIDARQPRKRAGRQETGRRGSRRYAPEAGCAGGALLLPRRRVVPVDRREDELRQHNEPRAAEADQHAVDATGVQQPKDAVGDDRQPVRTNVL
eukprot:COSAG04_NODE_1546_length_6404_cov_11.172638_5_plen_162_part_00